MLESFIQVLGRLHPMVLHMPIGILGGLVACEAVAVIRRRRIEASLRITLAVVAGVSAAIAAASGLLLSREDAYGGDTLDLHQWLGIGAAVGTIVTAALSVRTGVVAYRIMLVLTAGVLVPAGHFGAEMTHGEDFVLAPLRANPRTIVADGIGGSANSVYQASIAPILAARCLNCHGSTRQKSGLALHTPEDILAGGDSGSAIEPGDPRASEILVRMRLPLDDRDHMPPKQKGQPTVEEIAAIERWILDGARFDAGDVGESTAAPPVPPVPPPVVRPSPPPEALAQLAAGQVHAEATDPDSGLLWITFAAVPATTDEQAIALLTPLRDFIGELSLARTLVGDESMSMVGQMSNLRSLDLSATRITPGGLEKFAPLTKLEDLRLTRTTLDERAVTAIQGMPSLKRLFIWHAGLEPAAVDQLRAARPDLLVDAGTDPAAPLDTEPPIVLSSADAGSTKPASLQPINSVCPVSGKPIDRKFLVVHEGRVVGLCCEKCAAQFLAEPARFTVKAD